MLYWLINNNDKVQLLNCSLCIADIMLPRQVLTGIHYHYRQKATVTEHHIANQQLYFHSPLCSWAAYQLAGMYPHAYSYDHTHTHARLTALFPGLPR